MFLSFCKSLILPSCRTPVNPLVGHQAMGANGALLWPKSVMSHIQLEFASRGISSASCDDFQVLSLNHCQPVARPIMRRPQCFEFFAKLSGVSFIQRSEGAICGPIVLAKELHHFSRRKGISKVVLASSHFKIRHSVAQPLTHYPLITPQHWSWHSRRSD